jgi:hypothetical protein
VEAVRDDLVGLSDFAYGRLRERVADMTAAEYGWEPEVTTMAWRVEHIVSFLTERRNGPWLGRPVPRPATGATPQERLESAYASWRETLAGTDDASLAAPIGRGPYAESTRRSFVLHVLDELIHHAAEVALLRDLWAARQIV